MNVKKTDSVGFERWTLCVRVRLCGRECVYERGDCVSERCSVHVRERRILGEGVRDLR